MSIDWTKPVYDADGDEVFALRRPDGTTFEDAHGAVRVIDSYDNDLGWWAPNGTRKEFSNTPPMKDWENVVNSKAPGVPGNFRVRYGVRNGKPFAEVAE